MGKNYTLYINNPEFADEANKSGLVNSLLRAHYGEGAVPEKKPLPEVTKPPATEFGKVIILPETKEPEPDDYYKDLVYVQANRTIWNTVTGEQEFEMTPGDVRELVRRGQVR